MDPLSVLPVEVNVGILCRCTIQTVLRLEAASTNWRAFIAAHHELVFGTLASRLDWSMQDVIQQRNGLTPPPRDLATVIASKWSPNAETWANVHSWREYCRRKLALEANFSSEAPLVSDQILHGCDETRVWRMRPDYEARLLICTMETGGLWVCDMDTSLLLWSLDETKVSRYAHLEHSAGTLAFNPGESDTIQIWRRADLVEGSEEQHVRGAYVQIGSLYHDVRVRGWHLLLSTLCVVSDHGKGFVYDVAAQPPELKRTIQIDPDAYGHLEQTPSMVMYSMGLEGYHIYDKASGQRFGVLDPGSWELGPENLFHIKEEPTPHRVMRKDSRVITDFKITRLVRPSIVRLEQGGLPDSAEHQDDPEWGAGMIYGSLMIGIARGFVVVVSDWPQVAKDPSCASKHVSIVEYPMPAEHVYYRGGWLTIGGTSDVPRACFQMTESTLVLPLPEQGSLLKCDERQPPIIAIPNGSQADFDVPLPQVRPAPMSFMQMGEDSLLGLFWYDSGRSYSKIPRVISFAPWIFDAMPSESAVVEDITDEDGAGRHWKDWMLMDDPRRDIKQAEALDRLRAIFSATRNPLVHNDPGSAGV